MLPTSPRPGSAPSANQELFPVFLQQLSWLISGAHEAKRVLAAWLLTSPPPPSPVASVLAQGRRMTARHLVQLDQLLEGITLPSPATVQDQAIHAMLAQGNACLEGTGTESARYADLATVLHRVCSCFGTACASGGETAMVLGRVDIATVLASWAAAWRDLQQSLAAGQRPGSAEAAAR